jgi:pimeloyl-ACP methyl ester carboxylesterase
MRHMSAIIASSDRRPALRGLRVPSLVIHGTDDPLVRPVGGARTAKALPGAKLLRIEGMGHDLPREAWPRMVEAVAGVSGVRSGG